MYLEIIFGFIVMIGLGLSNSLMKKPSGVMSPVYMSFLRNLILSIGLLLLMIFFNPGFNVNLNVILYSTFLGFLSYVSLLTFFGALKNLSVSVASPISNSSIAITLILLAIFTKYTLNFLSIIMILILVLGIFLLSYSKEKSKISVKGLLYAFSTCILWGSIYYLFVMPSREIGPVFSTLVIEGSVVIFSGIHMLFSKKHNFEKIDFKIFKYVLLSAFLALIAVVFIKLGVLLPRVDITYLSMALVPLVSSIHGFVAYKEKLSKVQIAGFIVVLVSILLLSV